MYLPSFKDDLVSCNISCTNYTNFKRLYNTFLTANHFRKLLFNMNSVIYYFKNSSKLYYYCSRRRRGRKRDPTETYISLLTRSGQVIMDSKTGLPLYSPYSDEERKAYRYGTQSSNLLNAYHNNNYYSLE